LTDEKEKKLCSYITSKYPKQTDSKLSEIVEESVKEYLERKYELTVPSFLFSG